MFAGHCCRHHDEPMCSCSPIKLDAIAGPSSSSTPLDNETQCSSWPRPRAVRSRTRKRELYRQIRKQISYYFSDANLRTDRYMRSLISGNDSRADCEASQMVGNDRLVNNPVPLAHFLTFNKVKELTTDMEKVVRAFHHQKRKERKQVVFDAARKTVIRAVPYKLTDEPTHRILYVEGFDTNVKDIHYNLETMFLEYGQILSIRAPYFVNDPKKLMGHAFIEFRDPVSVQRAIKDFRRYQKKDPMAFRSGNTPRNDETPEHTDSNEEDTHFLDNYRLLPKSIWNEYRDKYVKMKKEAIQWLQTLTPAQRAMIDYGEEVKTTGFDSSNEPEFSMEYLGDENYDPSWAMLPSDDETNEWYLNTQFHESDDSRIQQQQCRNLKGSNEVKLSKKRRHAESDDLKMFKKFCLREESDGSQLTKKHHRNSESDDSILKKKPKLCKSVLFHLPEKQRTEDTPLMAKSHHKENAEWKANRSKLVQSAANVSKMDAVALSDEQNHTPYGYLTLYEFHVESNSAGTPKQLRTTLRDIFKTVDRYCDAPVPHKREIAFIDIRNPTFEHLNEGYCVFRAYIRTHTFEVAQRLTRLDTKNYIMARLLSDFGYIAKARVLTPTEVANYWKMVQKNRKSTND